MPGPPLDHEYNVPLAVKSLSVEVFIFPMCFEPFVVHSLVGFEF